MIDNEPIIVGGGLTGSLAAITLARRGLTPRVIERGPPHDSTEAPSGRTINLALADRGLAALEAAGVRAAIEPLLLPMTGRIIHDRRGHIHRLPYGQRPTEQIYSVSRAQLSRRLFEVARDRHGVAYHFNLNCLDYQPKSGQLTLQNNERAREARIGASESPESANATSRATTTADQHAAEDTFELETPLLIGADGAGSVIRRALAAAGLTSNDEALLDHGYKELLIQAGPDGSHRIAADGLHIWPRGGFMLIALPNTDGTFTATLFLPQKGSQSFKAAQNNPVDFFRTEFPDALELLPDLEDQFAANPVGIMGTVYCDTWHHSVPRKPGQAQHECLLLGDAAHAIVPFHGQGINAGFEDCVVLDKLLDRFGTDWAKACASFAAQRPTDTRAIATMALENYIEMRDGVRDPQFERRRKLAFELERLTEGRFTPRYSLVMFHAEIGYAEAERRGAIQADILQRATATDEDDIELALTLVDERL